MTKQIKSAGELFADSLPSRRAFMTAMGAGALTGTSSIAPSFARAADTATETGHITRDHWASLLDRLKSIDAQVDPALISDPDVRDRYYRHSLQVMAVFYAYAMVADPSNPYWLPLQNYIFTTASPNPDTIYYCAPIAGDGAYRISGLAGQSNIIDFQWGAGVIGHGWPGPRLGGVAVSDLGTDDNGYFELFLGGKAPPDKKKNWRPLPENAAMASIRVIAADWAKVKSPAFAIERLDTPVRRVYSDDETIAQRAERFVSAVEQWTNTFVQKLPARMPHDRLEQTNFGGEGGLQGQYYYHGRFHLENDEALMIEAKVPARSDYWNIQLDDELFSTFDYAALQCSLNNVQAHIDDDGMFRAVIALENPGVPNWLDTGGYPRGIVLGRWLNADAPTTPSMTRIKLANISKHLPPQHPRITAEEREKAMRERRELAQLRRLW